MAASMIVALGLASIVLLSTVLIAAAFLLRGEWDKMGGGSGQHSQESSSATPTTTAPGTTRPE